MTEQTIIERESPENYNLHKAECKHYEPQSNIEGICMLSPNLTFVSRVGGCDHFQDCPIYLRNKQK